ncbi:MAG TPA: xylulokinase, partial [Gaiellaceae bacterium]
MRALVAIDVGTTGVKAIAIDEQGKVLAGAERGYVLSTPQPGWAEQSPEDWWAAAEAALAEVSAGREVAGIGLSGQMHGLVCLDARDRVIRPAILWNDQRTAAECTEIEERVGRSRLIELTGNRALTGFTAPKLLWLRRHEPDAYARIAHVMLPKDYVRLRLTGERATDVADASGTLLFDVAGRRWSDEVLGALELPAAWLPEALESPAISGTVRSGALAGVPVAAGAGDQAAAALGVGVDRPGPVSVVLGTSGVVLAALPAYAHDPEARVHAFCHAVPERWHLMSVMLSAAGSLRWLRDTVAPGLPYPALVEPAAAVPAGSDGLWFLPYLSGERSPHPDPLARGAFVGLTVRHTRAHMARAVLEGVAFGLKDSFQLMASAGLPSEKMQVRVSGGGVKSGLWRQILADVIGATLVSTNSTEGAAYGAALLASVGAGVYPDVQTACKQTIRTSDATEPGAQSSDYAHAYELYGGLYPALKETFTRI